MEGVEFLFECRFNLQIQEIIAIYIRTSASRLIQQKTMKIKCQSACSVYVSQIIFDIQLEIQSVM
jgi:hypothetical protein